MFQDISVLHYVICYIAGHICGSVPCGLWICKMIYDIDIRDYGSKNIGTTNVFRTVGWPAAIAVLIGDILKGLLVVILVDYLFHNPGLNVAAALGAFLGHSYSVFLGFKGGKSVATGVGMIIFLMPKVAASVTVVWLILVLATRYVSLGSIVAALTAPFFAWCFDNPMPYILLTVFAAIMINVRHKDNIKRLMSGTESKIKPGKFEKKN